MSEEGPGRTNLRWAGTWGGAPQAIQGQGPPPPSLDFSRPLMRGRWTACNLCRSHPPTTTQALYEGAFPFWGREPQRPLSESELGGTEAPLEPHPVYSRLSCCAGTSQAAGRPSIRLGKWPSQHACLLHLCQGKCPCGGAGGDPAPWQHTGQALGSGLGHEFGWGSC